MLPGLQHTAGVEERGDETVGVGRGSSFRQDLKTPGAPLAAFKLFNRILAITFPFDLPFYWLLFAANVTRYCIDLAQMK